MTHGRDDKKPAGRVAEPVQVYLQPPDRERLERLIAALLDLMEDDGPLATG